MSEAVRQTEHNRLTRERDEPRARYASLCIGDPYSGNAYVAPVPAGVTLALRDALTDALTDALRERDEARAVVTRIDAARAEEEQRAFTATLALHNVRALAVRLRKVYPEAADHLLRFCESAGVVGSPLRGANES
jgi:hypothetical protein